MSHRIQKANEKMVICASNLHKVKKQFQDRLGEVKKLQSQVKILQSKTENRDKSLESLVRRMARKVRQSREELQQKAQELADLKIQAKQQLFSGKSNVQSDYENKLRDIEAKYRQKLDQAEQQFRINREESVGMKNRMHEVERMHEKLMVEKEKLQTKYENEVQSCTRDCDRKVSDISDDLNSRIQKISIQLNEQTFKTASCENNLAECSKVIPAIAKVKTPEAVVEPVVVQPMPRPRSFLDEIRKRRIEPETPVRVTSESPRVVSPRMVSPKAPEVPRGRVDLLAAIRGAGGANLKKAHERQLRTPVAKNEGSGIADQVRKAMQARRTAIDESESEEDWD